MVLILSRQPINQLHSLLNDEVGVRDRIINEITEVVGSDYAHIFARPEYVKDTVRWGTDGEKSLTWKDLSSDQREKLLTAAKSILSDIRYAAQNHPNALFAQFFEQYKQFPSLEYLYAVDGRPVITAWGYGGINGFFDLVPSHLQQVYKRSRSALWVRFPWITSLVALSAGLLVSVLWSVWYHSNKVCFATYPPEKIIQEALKEIDKNKQLTDKKSQLLKLLDGLRKQCKVPPISPLLPQEIPELDPVTDPEPMPELPVPQDKTDLPKAADIPQKQDPPKPKERVDLPKDAWNKKDTSMLDGCWNLTTHLELYQRRFFGSSHQPVTNWSLCFNPDSTGRQVLTRKDGGTCSGPLRATFQGNQLVLQQPTDCQGAFNLIPGKNVCTRLNDHEAQCTYIDAEGHQSTGTFRR